MQVSSHFKLAMLNLLNAEHQCNNKQYCEALLLLTKAYPHVRQLIEKVYELDRLTTQSKKSPGDNHE